MSNYTIAISFILLLIAVPINAAELPLYQSSSAWQLPVDAGSCTAGTSQYSPSYAVTSRSTGDCLPSSVSYSPEGQLPSQSAICPVSSQNQSQQGLSLAGRPAPQLGSAYQGYGDSMLYSQQQPVANYPSTGRPSPVMPASFAPARDDIRQMTEPIGGSDYIQPLGSVAPIGSPSQNFVATEGAMIELMNEDPDKPPAGLRRNGFFQSIHFQTTWLAPMGDRYLEMFEAETWMKLVIPGLFDRSMVMFTPGFGIHTFEGADDLEIPDRVFDVYVNTSFRGYIGTRWSYNATVMFGWYGDTIGSNVGGSPFRLRGFGMGVYKLSDEVDIALGAVYIDYGQYRILPAAGLTWVPSDDWKLNLSFPYPRLSHRVYFRSTRPKPVEYWMYLAGEIGGGTWQVRMDGQFNGKGEPISDMLSYTDWRIMLGLERRGCRGFETRFEVGYCFARELEYDDRGDTTDLPGTLMLRALALY